MHVGRRLVAPFCRLSDTWDARGYTPAASSFVSTVPTAKGCSDGDGFSAA
jgi:hypothetical protein